MLIELVDLLVSRFKEEIHAGLKTGIIRSMAGTGGVVTAAGLVFAFTMASMVGSDMRAVGQFGSTVCVGLLLNTLIVRSLLLPSIATLLGRWFWWPQVVHTHAILPAGPAAPPVMCPPSGVNPTKKRRELEASIRKSGRLATAEQGKIIRRLKKAEQKQQVR